jgi:hypothetical protein
MTKNRFVIAVLIFGAVFFGLLLQSIVSRHPQLIALVEAQLSDEFSKDFFKHGEQSFFLAKFEKTESAYLRDLLPSQGIDQKNESTVQVPVVYSYGIPLKPDWLLTLENQTVRVRPAAVEPKEPQFQLQDLVIRSQGGKVEPVPAHWRSAIMQTLKTDLANRSKEQIPRARAEGEDRLRTEVSQWLKAKYPSDSKKISVKVNWDLSEPK